MNIQYVDIGVCGLSCRLCPMFNSEGASRCEGCKSEGRMAVGCPFITCAVKKKGIEFCWQCEESSACPKWQKHRELGKQVDSFKTYRTLESDIAFIEDNGISKFDETQSLRAGLLKELLAGFNDGRSKSYFCIAATVMQIGDLEEALQKAKELSNSMNIKEKAKLIHSLLDNIATQRGYELSLRKSLPG